jgi:hypothetical protein
MHLYVYDFLTCRRDNRPDAQRPGYITNMDAEDYRGRELTEVHTCVFMYIYIYIYIFI